MLLVLNESRVVQAVEYLARSGGQVLGSDHSNSPPGNQNRGSSASDGHRHPAEASPPRRLHADCNGLRPRDAGIGVHSHHYQRSGVRRTGCTKHQDRGENYACSHQSWLPRCNGQSVRSARAIVNVLLGSQADWFTAQVRRTAFAEIQARSTSPVLPGSRSWVQEQGQMAQES